MARRKFSSTTDQWVGPYRKQTSDKVLENVPKKEKKKKSQI